MALSLQRVLRRLRYGRPIIIVSGLPRSGTSVAMNMLNAAGMPLVTDGARLADDDNPRGYFEDERVKDLDKEEDRAWLKGARGKVVKIVAPLLPYLPETHNYKIIFMHRDLREVLASQKKMLERRGERSETDDERMLQLYEKHLERVRFLLKYRPCFDVIDVQYGEVIRDPRGQARRLNRFLGRPLDVEKMAGVVDAKLYRNRR